jgi:hypothetical protein
MADLVTEMTEQRAIGFAHRRAAVLALGVVGLRQRDGDAAAVMAGQHFGADRHAMVVEKFEDEALRILGAGAQRQFEAQQRVDQSMFGQFDLAPQPDIAFLREVGNGSVMAAGGAGAIGRIGGDEPVAAIVVGVQAKPVGAFAIPVRRPVLAARLDDGEKIGPREITEPARTFFASGVLEEQHLSAGLAFEKLHRFLSLAPTGSS